MHRFSRLTRVTKRNISTSAPQAPKASIDFKSIRQNPQLFSNNCVNKNYPSLQEHPFKIVAAFDKKKDILAKAQPLRRDINGIEARIAKLPSAQNRVEGETTVTERAALKEEAGRLKDQLRKLEDHEHTLEAEVQALAVELPNLISPDTPVTGEPRRLSIGNEHLMGLVTSKRAWKDHFIAGIDFDLIGFEPAGTTTGRGWYFLKNEAVELEIALVAYALDAVKKHGFSLQAPPSMVRGYMAEACGFRPRDKNEEQQSYKIAQSERDAGKSELHLAATAEIPFAASKAGKTFHENELPIRIAGQSRCYRAEAGARGQETKGLYRVHEFTKVEMFTWCRGTDAASLFEKMLDIQKQILTELGLLFQVMEMPAPDLGASAYRKVDIEAWFPSRKARNGGWGEVTSLSNCKGYQTRRLNTRVKLPNGKGLEFPHTLNGTALAVPRVLMGILEMGWDKKEDVIRIPEVLWPYMGDRRVIGKKR